MGYYRTGSGSRACGSRPAGLDLAIVDLPRSPPCSRHKALSSGTSLVRACMELQVLVKSKSSRCATCYSRYEKGSCCQKLDGPGNLDLFDGLSCRRYLRKRPEMMFIAAYDRVEFDCFFASKGSSAKRSEIRLSPIQSSTALGTVGKR